MARFGANDLRGLLGGDNEPSSSLHSGSFQPRVDASRKVSRLRAGVTPKWAADMDGEASVAGAAMSGSAEGVYEEVVEVVTDRSRGLGPAQASETLADNAAPVVIDRRLKLAAASTAASSAIGGSEGGSAPRRRRIYEAEVIVEAATSAGAAEAEPAVAAMPAPHRDEDMSAVDAVAARRARARQAEREREDQDVPPASLAAAPSHWQQKAAVAPTALPSSSGSDSSEYETDSDSSEEDEQVAAHAAPRPVFVPRVDRDAAYAAKAAEGERLQERERARKKQQQQTSRQMVAEGLRRADTASATHDDNDEDFGLPDDTDGVAPEREFEEWQLRELTRLQIDVERRRAHAAEAAELLRRRQRTDEEVGRELQEGRATAGLDASAHPKPRAKSGVFYIDEGSLAEGDVRLRDTSGLTGVQASRKSAEEQRKAAAAASAQVLGTASGRRQVKEEE